MESPMCGSTFYSITAAAAIKKVCWIWRILQIKTEASALDSTTPSTTAYHIGHTERQKFTTRAHTQRLILLLQTHTLAQLEFILHERSQTEVAVAVAQKGMKSI